MNEVNLKGLARIRKQSEGILREEVPPEVEILRVLVARYGRSARIGDALSAEQKRVKPRFYCKQ